MRADRMGNSRQDEVFGRIACFTGNCPNNVFELEFSCQFVAVLNLSVVRVGGCVEGYFDHVGTIDGFLNWGFAHIGKCEWWLCLLSGRKI